MNQVFDPTEIYQPDGTLELFDDSEADFASEDITAFPLAALFQEAGQPVEDFSYLEPDEVLLVA